MASVEGEESLKRPRKNRARTIVNAFPARSSSGRARAVTTFTDVTMTQYSTPKEMFTPDWDGLIASEQSMARVQERVDMGQKMTPRGPGRLRPARR